MNNDTNILTMPNISAEMTIDADGQALIQAISTAITNGFSGLNSLQVDAVTQIEINKNNITSINNSIGDFITPLENPTDTDLNNYTKTGIYTGNFSGFTNYPATYQYAILEVIASTNYIKQTLILTGETYKSFFVRTCVSGVWRDWREYKSWDSLPMEQTITFSNNAPCTLNVSNYWRGEIVLMGSQSDQMGYYLCRATSTGYPYIYGLKTATNVTITVSNNTIVLSSSDYCGGYVKTVNGTCTVS